MDQTGLTCLCSQRQTSEPHLCSRRVGDTGLRTSLVRNVKFCCSSRVSVPASEPVVLFNLLISYWNLLHNFFLNIVAHNLWSIYTARTSIILYTAATERMVIPFSGEPEVQTMHYLQNATRSCTSAVHTADSAFSKFSASLE